MYCEWNDYIEALEGQEIYLKGDAISTEMWMMIVIQPWQEQKEALSKQKEWLRLNSQKMVKFIKF
jgi:hypothetical protein